MKKGDKMKKIKAILSIILVFAIGIGGSGCMSAGKDLYKNQSEIQAEKAEEMLKEKYGKEFVVDSLGGRWGTATDATYTCICHPADDENLSFKAIVGKEYSFMHDGYATKIGELNFENDIANALKAFDEDVRVLVESYNRTIESPNYNLLPEDFISLNHNADIYIRVLIDTDIYDDSLITTLKNYVSKYSCLNGYIYVYAANINAKEGFDKWKKSKDFDDYNCGELLTKEYDCEAQAITIHNGKIQ